MFYVFYFKLQQELKDLDDKFKKAMFHNAQLDNEKASFSYQVELLKDQIEQLEEGHFLLQVSLLLYKFIFNLHYIKLFFRKNTKINVENMVS